MLTRDATVAGAGRILALGCLSRLLLFRERARHLLCGSLLFDRGLLQIHVFDVADNVLRWQIDVFDVVDNVLGASTLSTADFDIAVLDKALYHPVVGTGAVDARVNTGVAEIVVSLIADAAVVVLVFHGQVAVVAVDDPRCRLHLDLWTDGQVGVAR
jgi:hypothetical protein